MRSTKTKIFTNADMSQATLASIGMYVDQIKDWSIQAVWTGSAVGVFKIQVSNDIVTPGTGTDLSIHVVNWSDYTGSTYSMSAAGDFGWLAQNSGYQWVRLFYTKTSGTGSLNATFSGKEN